MTELENQLQQAQDERQKIVQKYKKGEKHDIFDWVCNMT
jgi:hypothetical protein